MLSGKQKKEQLLNCYKSVEGFIYKQALYLNSVCGADIEDLRQEGYFGVSKAYDHFDASKASFFTYVQYWIKSYMNAYAYKFNRFIKVPEEYNFIYARYLKNVDKYGVPSTKEEFKKMAASISVTENKLHMVLEAMACFKNSIDIDSLEESPSLEDDLSNLVSDSGFNFVEKLKNTVTPEEFFVIDHRLALTVPTPKTLTWIGHILGISKERVRQIENAGLDKFKSRYRKELESARVQD